MVIAKIIAYNNIEKIRVINIENILNEVILLQIDYIDNLFIH